ncbi:hypothetical protein C8Q80DRAFT_709587 [Daedaleopsis nitida]|nr:hypothetical protein C8Q80DRAFT_709587 [Daedaleopsis nitida]
MRRRQTHKSQPSWYTRAEPLAQYVPITDVESTTLSLRYDSYAEGRCPSPAVGYALIAGSLLFLLVGSYAVFFSAFAPPGGTGIWVRAHFSLSAGSPRRMYIVAQLNLTRRTVATGAGRPRGGQALQVPARHAHLSRHCVRDLELGRVAVLQEFVN